MPNPKTCAVRGCDYPARARGWCRAHYQRWLEHGDPLGGAPARTRPPVRYCSVVGCKTPAEVRGMCTAHYKRWQKHGDPTVRERGSRPPEYSSEEMVAAIRDWTALFGEPPTTTDWRGADRRRFPWRQERYEATGRTWPSTEQVIHFFGSWPKALRYAGVKRKYISKPHRRSA